ncbi:MAG TPA: tetratricopeptide repeat protein [Pyrinomonadaceae bacterium]|jgi:tetratricopeptide (TPR) repeat protein
MRNLKRFVQFISLICLLACCAPLGAAQQRAVPAGNDFRQDVPVAASTLFERAVRMAKAGKGELAQTLLKESLKLYPDYFDAHLALGNELSKAGRLSEAMTEFELARKINPRDDQVYLSVGLVMMQQKRYDLAASVFADASLLNRTEPLHRLMRGIALVRQASTLKQPTSKSALSERNSLYRKAEEALSEAYNLSSGRLAEVYLYRALIYEQRGERELAATELEQYLQQSQGAENAETVREAIRKLREPVTGAGTAHPPSQGSQQREQRR